MTAKNDASKIADRLWYRKTVAYITKEQLDRELREKIATGEITAIEAEHEWHDYVDRYENCREW